MRDDLRKASLVGPPNWLVSERKGAQEDIVDALPRVRASYGLIEGGWDAIYGQKAGSLTVGNRTDRTSQNQTGGINEHSVTKSPDSVTKSPDSATLDLNKRTEPRINEQDDPNKRTRGRPKKWDNDADRMRSKRGN